MAGQLRGVSVVGWQCRARMRSVSREEVLDGVLKDAGCEGSSIEVAAGD